MRAAPVQTVFAFRTHGGRRPGAGRPPTRLVGGRRLVSHAARPVFERLTPVHVTLRCRAEAPRLRGEKAYGAIVRALCAAAGSGAAAFRVVQYSVQSNHLHLLVEAETSSALARGVQGLEVRIARGVNRALGRRGPLFADRYHAVPIASPRQARHALGYVLNNARRHAAQGHATYARGWIDPCSSAETFYRSQRRGRREVDLNDGSAPVRPARTWLLSTGFGLHGRLSPDEIPGDPPAWLPRGG